MCHIACIIFGAVSLSADDVRGKKVLEIGSYDVNGSLRPIIESWNPQSYIGIDIVKGPGVDVLCKAENLAGRFGDEAFDLVIATELLEHVLDWKEAVANIKLICKENGLILITTRSRGFEYHGYPYDFWRYDTNDMTRIFSDCTMVKLENDRQAPGVLALIRKPFGFSENNLSEQELYCIMTGKRQKTICRNDFYCPAFMLKKGLYFLNMVQTTVMTRIQEMIRRCVHGS